MAMLRNIRNMIQAGISGKHHQWVLKKLTDEGAVVHSRQFPFRYKTMKQQLQCCNFKFFLSHACNKKITLQVFLGVRSSGSTRKRLRSKPARHHQRSTGEDIGHTRPSCAWRARRAWAWKRPRPRSRREKQHWRWPS